MANKAEVKKIKQDIKDTKVKIKQKQKDLKDLKKSLKKAKKAKKKAKKAKKKAKKAKKMTVQDDESRYPRPVRNDPVVRVIHKLWSTTVPTARASIVWMISEFQFKDGKKGRSHVCRQLDGF